MTASINNLSLPLVAKIVGYVCHADDRSQLVGRVFCAARQRAMQEEWREGAFMSNRAPSFPLQLLEQEIVKRDHLREELKSKINAHHPPKKEIARIWSQMISHHGCSIEILQSEDEIFWMSDMLHAKAIERWKEHSRERINILDQHPVNWQEQVRCTRVFNAREGLALRERRIQLLEVGDPENPKQITQCFEKLYKEQKEQACLTPEGRRAFMQIPRNFSFTYNRAREFVVQDTMAEMHINLSRVWQVIRQRFNVAPPAGIPDLNARTADVRGWLNNPANQPHLDKITHLYIGGEAHRAITAIPREIVNLRYLSGLQISKVSRLPDFLTQLRYLDYIYADNNVKEIPDALYRHLESTLYIVEGRNGAINTNGPLERIPFRMWFKQQFTLPHYSLVGKGFDCLYDFWRNSYWRHGVIDFISYLIMGAILLPIDLLINAPIFLYNLFMIDVVEPIITLIRDLSGISRMVRIR